MCALRTSFERAASLQPFYSGGPAAASADGALLATAFGGDVVLTDAATARQVHRISGDTEELNALALAPNDAVLAAISRSLALRFYTLPDYALRHSVARAHEAPVAVMRADPTSSLLATGAADGVVKVWDLAGAFCTHVFRGHGGVVSALAWHVARTGARRTVLLITGCVDGKVRVWDLNGGAEAAAKPVAVLAAHAGVVRALGVSPDGTTLVSGARDQTLALWDMSPQGRCHRRETLMCGELVEALGFLPSGEFWTAGSSGALRVWRGSRVVAAAGAPPAEPAAEAEADELRGLTDALYCPAASMVITVSATQDLSYYTVPDATLVRQLAGYNDEVVDMALVDGNALAVATNNSQLRIYRLDTHDHDVALLDGHRDIVLSLDASADRRWLASGSKDRTARIWARAGGVRPVWHVVAVCEGHAESVGAVAFARRAAGALAAPFVVTASQDRTVKVWDLSGVAAGTDARPSSLATLRIHDKDINAIDIAPNNALLLSGSQDRTAKVYALSYTEPSRANGARARVSLTALATCRGHKRGVWSVRFSPAEQAFATASSDQTVRLWSLRDFACVRVFEGHTGGVLRVNFLPGGAQLASSAADGLVKVWNVRDEECAATLDAHEDKIWTLAVCDATDAAPLRLVSGGADSTISVWADCTAAREAEAAAAREHAVHREQEFANLLVLKDYRGAIALAFALDQPRRLLTLFAHVATSRAEGDAVAAVNRLVTDALGEPPAAATPDAPGTSITGLAAIDEIVRTLPKAHLAQLLGYIRDWNAVSRTAGVAQLLLHAVVRLHSADAILDAFGAAGASGVLEALEPYTERHYARADRALVESAMLEYTLAAMDALGAHEMDI